MATGIGYALDFERPLIELEKKIEELKVLSTSGTVDFSSEISKLEKKAKKLQTEIFSDLTRWQVVQLSRHSARPYFLDYVHYLFTDFFEMCGDRHFGEDPSIVGGFARFDGKTVMLIGHQKGRNTKENMARNFGMPRPEGYRKARRLMELAERMEKPILTFVDTPGAYPGIGAEERGQAEAIAMNLEVMSRLRVPIISTVVGEGGSGGALAIGVGNRVLMFQNSVYSVISPEGCASILFRDATKADKAADAMRPTAPDLLEMKIIDEVIPEPPGGAHRDPAKAAEALGKTLRKHLGQLAELNPDALVRDRYDKFRALGMYSGK
ncbi:acetyl-CoA carboxylase carboxyltransferase subunit alpha [Corallococcus exiguus]|uniref:Acetyl-coenzyme A carboxylase carboxyl transferase subunit alpha n=1 Tax=Corallococcus exiguus TaxID=83462 RepID=A0A7Y1S630_9BACT|nr:MULTISPECIES: acetyl-CoA carboxylase carboxyltransferase subunit alpha [Corallococcus]NBC43552.1 acetyl-CoA carboxylase carboxyltransferase subunit alpha [Corallococcus exiguus]NNB84478.1 acetyl-CoA carboxylase carboxyltransferase subunit alpha [Corallococcus exiguus]NNC04889.1 acetyl-CoA carboxylase carboxyltransferase subunit alpha [Corallococcus exiguus]NNC18922.1 acetyl-CoA carboxylase carboxyltransferase subunit alpha [Corallococcus exiguus]NPC45883.1 acetyl-CoA carboxylase carboxyltra